MSIAEFYDSIKSKKNNTELNQLYKKPKPENGINMPSYQVFKPNITHQADLLYMPNDNGYKYILVVVDLHNKKLDAEAIKSKVQGDNKILHAFMNIYEKNKILKFPRILIMDNGIEFKSVNLQNYLMNNNVYIKYGQPGRHRQLAVVEKANYKIGSILHKRMASEELLTGQISRYWKNDLKELITVLNKHLPKPITQPKSNHILYDKYSGDLIPIGARVRVLLDHPEDTYKGNWLSGKFRASDIRWSPEIHRITDLELEPGFPPLYIIDDNYNVKRTKHQLQIVSDNIIPPDNKYIREKSEFHIINKIIDKKKIKNKIYYLINWRGYDNNNNSWIPSSELDRTRDLKEMKKEFNINYHNK